MQKAGMVHSSRQIAEGRLKYLARLDRASAWRRFARTQVPHAPRCAVQDRFDEDGAQIEIASMRAMSKAHRVGEGIVPGALVVDGLTQGVAFGKRFDESALRRRDAVGERECSARRVIGAGERLGLAGGILQVPVRAGLRPSRD